MTYEELLKDARTRLEQAGVESAATDAMLILSRVAKLGSANIYAVLPEQVPGDVVNKFRKALELRAARKPLQLILGDTVFMGLRFVVDGNELIPRPDTEILVQEAMEIWHRRDEAGEALSVLDICTGSGCIAVSLARYGRFSRVSAGDISEKALANARMNAKINKVNIDFECGDLFAPFAGEKFDIITANPPYIRSGDIDGLQTEVRDYDPREALDGGEDGLDFYRRIAGEVRDHLREGGSLLLEIGSEQAEDVSALMSGAGFDKVRVIKDYAGLDRVIVCE